MENNLESICPALKKCDLGKNFLEVVKEVKWPDEIYTNLRECWDKFITAFCNGTYKSCSWYKAQFEDNN